LCYGLVERPKTHLLRLNLIQAQIPYLAILLATHPFSVRGVHIANETSLKELQRLFARSHESFARSRESFLGGYTSQDFVTVGCTCAIATALQSPTSIYRG